MVDNLLWPQLRLRRILNTFTMLQGCHIVWRGYTPRLQQQQQQQQPLLTVRRTKNLGMHTVVTTPCIWRPSQQR